MDFSNLLQFVDDQACINDEKELLEIQVTSNIRHLGHNQSIKASPFANFIVYDSDVEDEDDDDTEEEFPEEQTQHKGIFLNFASALTNNNIKEYDEAPMGHNPMI